MQHKNLLPNVPKKNKKLLPTYTKNEEKYYFEQSTIKQTKDNKKILC